MAKTKISIVRYLNSVPLAWGILNGPQADLFDPVLSTPAECADQLMQGKVDIGLIPSIEYHKMKGVKIVPGPAIACRHRVRSVLLVSEMPLWKIKTVAYDNGSRSSVALAKIVLKEFYRCSPDFRPSEPNLETMLAQSDAAVIIGDAALQFMEWNENPDADKQRSMIRLGPQPLYVFDLVERWKFLTGLPFVFAFWAVREGFKDQQVAEALRASRDLGVAAIPAIAEQYSEKLTLKKEYVQKYLEQNVSYFMDQDCVEGLNLFYDKAAADGITKSERPLEFL